MNTSTMPAATTPYASGTQPNDRARTVVNAAALALAAATEVALLVTRPWGERNQLGYERIAPIRDAAWTGLLLDGFAFAILGITLGLAACRLATQRGRVAALVAAVLTTSGGVLFAMGSFGFATLAWYATSDAISADAGTDLLGYVEDNPAHFYGVTGAGFLLFTIGTFVVLAAMWRSRAIPAAAVVAVIVLTIAQFAPLPGRALDLLQVALMVCWIGLAGVLLRRTETKE